jgi:1-acyl-sn-glycerol-3-phosphate acyltransferase
VTVKSEGQPSQVSAARSSKLLAVWRFMRILGVTVRVATGCYLKRLPLSEEDDLNTLFYRGTQTWLAAITRIIGIDVTVVGNPPRDKAALIAPNHTTYADIFVLPTALPVWFVSKADVLHWPVFGRIFRFSRNLTVNRENRRSLRDTNEAITQRIQAGYNVCVFLEGTSSGGDSVLPFRGPLLQPALDGAVYVVPVSITWRADDPAINLSEDIAYWKDHATGPHLFRFLGFQGIHCTIRFGEAIPATGDRKELAEKVQRVVAEMHGDCLAQ